MTAIPARASELVAFRETTLFRLAEADRMVLTRLGEMLHLFALEYGRPSEVSSPSPADELRAVAGDLVHLRNLLARIAQDADAEVLGASESSLASLAGVWSGKLLDLALRIEGEVAACSILETVPGRGRRRWELVVRDAHEINLPLALVAELAMKAGDLFAIDVEREGLRLVPFRDLMAEGASSSEATSSALAALLDGSVSCLGDLGRLPIPERVPPLRPGARLFLRVRPRGGGFELLLGEASASSTAPARDEPVSSEA